MYMCVCQTESVMMITRIVSSPLNHVPVMALHSPSPMLPTLQFHAAPAMTLRFTKTHGLATPTLQAQQTLVLGHSIQSTSTTSLWWVLWSMLALVIATIRGYTWLANNIYVQSISGHECEKFAKILSNFWIITVILFFEYIEGRLNVYPFIGTLRGYSVFQCMYFPVLSRLCPAGCLHCPHWSFCLLQHSTHQNSPANHLCIEKPQSVADAHAHTHTHHAHTQQWFS